MTWQPIETAPEDEYVLVFYGEANSEMADAVSIAFCFGGQWLDWDGDLYGVPTHWQPLPLPPEGV